MPTTQSKAPRSKPDEIVRRREPRYPKDPDEYNVEPAWLVDSLLRFLAIPKGESVYDPAAGSGTIPRRAQAWGYRAFGTDIKRRSKWINGRANFVKRSPLSSVENIITNPPFTAAIPFVRRALSIATKRVAIIQRLSYLEGGDRLASLWRELPPTWVCVSVSRASMPPGHLLRKGLMEPKGGKISYAWFVWILDPSAAPPAPSIPPPSLTWLERK